MYLLYDVVNHLFGYNMFAEDDLIRLLAVSCTLEINVLFYHQHPVIMLQLLYVPPVEEALNVDLLPEVDLSLPLELVHP